MLLFDLDGTLIDSNGVWLEVDKTFLARHGFAYSQEYHDGVAHSILQNCAIFTKNYFQMEESCEEIIAEWMDLAKGVYDAVPLKPHVRAYLDRCKAAGHRMAVFTACVPEHCQTAVRNHGLDVYFEKIIYAQELGEDKRSPAVFRRAAEKLSVLEKQRQRTLLVQYAGSSRVIPLENIRYVESHGHKLLLHLKEGTVEYYGKIGELEQELGGQFARIHKGYLVNLRHVEEYARGQVTLTGGEKLTISKYKYDAFVKQHLRFLRQ